MTGGARTRQERKLSSDETAVLAEIRSCGGIWGMVHDADPAEIGKRCGVAPGRASKAIESMARRGVVSVRPVKGCRPTIAVLVP